MNSFVFGAPKSLAIHWPGGRAPMTGKIFLQSFLTTVVAGGPLHP